MALREYAGAAKRTAISGDITAASTTITVADATGYPTGATGPFAIALALGQAAEEKVLITSRSGNTLTVHTRGYDGTSASSHSSGAPVDHVLTAIDIREANSVTTDHGQAYDSARLGGMSAPLYLLTSDANTAYATKAEASMQVVAEMVLGSAAASVVFSSIPTTWRHLRLVIVGRGDSAAVNVQARLRMNGDTGNMYDSQQLDATGSATGAVEEVAQSSILIGTLAAASAPAAAAGVLDINLPHYRGAFRKTATSVGFEQQTDEPGGQKLRVRGGVWRSGVALNSLTLYPSAGNFAAGSVFTLYGTKGT